MAERRFAIALVALTTFCTLLLLVCPVAVGPYSATHGPATALRAIRALAILLFAMFFYATALNGVFRAPGLFSPVPAAIESASDRGRAGGMSSELRC